MGDRDHGVACANGHWINSSAGRFPEDTTKHCKKCGAPAVGQCPSCGSEVHGEYSVPGVLILASPPKPPAYCHDCGKPYPWTDAKLLAVGELLELSGATEPEKEQLKADLSALAKDEPRSGVAAARWKRFLLGGGKEIADAARKLVVDVASDAIKKSLLGP